MTFTNDTIKIIVYYWQHIFQCLKKKSDFIFHLNDFQIRMSTWTCNVLLISQAGLFPFLFKLNVLFNLFKIIKCMHLLLFFCFSLSIQPFLHSAFFIHLWNDFGHDSAIWCALKCVNSTDAEGVNKERRNVYLFIYLF